jgi:hypothetical protein
MVGFEETSSKSWCQERKTEAEDFMSLENKSNVIMRNNAMAVLTSIT